MTSDTPTAENNQLPDLNDEESEENRPPQTLRR